MTTTAHPRIKVGRWKRRASAAEYLDISASTFDKWVAEGTLPGPYRHNGIALWDTVELDAAIMDLRDPALVENDTGGW